MNRLSDAELIRVWETARDWHPVDQSLALLCAATPEHSHDEVARLPLGQRDARLLALRRALFGDRIDGVAACPRCGERLEFELSCAGLTMPPGEAPPREVRLRDYRVRLRALDSHDLAAVAGMADAERARRLLLSRCVLEACRGRDALAAELLPDDVAAAVSDALLEADPQAEILLDLACPACGRPWQAVLDIARIAWNEIAGQARRLLAEVHALASAYGWREDEILALGPARRATYLQMVNS